MNSVSGTASPQTAVPTMESPSSDTAQILEAAMANLKEPGGKVEEYWAFGERYWFTAARPDLRLDDERHHKSDDPKVVEERQEQLLACNVKVRDFAFALNNPKTQSCRCRLTAMRRSEWNKILKFHGMTEMEVHIPQQIIASAPRSRQNALTQPNSAATTQPNSPAATEPNSPARTEPPSPARTVGPSAFRTQGLSRQPNAADLASALAAATNHTLTVDATSANDTEVTVEAPTRAPSPMPAQLTGTSALRQEVALTTSIYRADVAIGIPVTGQDVEAVGSCGTETVVGVTTEPNTPTPPAAVSLPVPASISALGTLPIRRPTAQSLSRMVFGGDSPLTPWSGTPNGSNVFSGDSLKRKRSVAGLGKTTSNNNVLCKVSGEKIKDETTRSKKRAHKTTEKVPPTTRATRSSSKKSQTSNTTGNSVPSPHTSTKVRPTTSVRLGRAAAAALATPSKVKQAVLGKLTRAKAKVVGKRQGR